jgi:diguanylate cyclase (GGDEF)-like protein
LGGSFILAINLALGAAIMISFLAFGLYDRSLRAAYWWFAACLTGVIAGAIEYSMPSAAHTEFARFLIFTTFAVSVACLSIGLALRYGDRIPFTAVGIGLAASVAVYLAIADLPRTSMTRIVAYQLPYAGLQFIGLYYLLKGRERTLLDSAVVAAVVLNIAQYLARPPMVILFGGNGATAQDYLSTNYAMASQTLMAIATIVIAFVLGIRMLADVLSKIQTRSQIDHLSGMLNREGFSRQVETALAGAGRSSVPMTLVLCDLDHFKAVNDTYGHQAGDLVISRFGRLLMASKRGSDLGGRIGGEEFCVLLVNCDAAGGRLFAEHLRSAFAGLDLGLPPVASHCTASFGVTEIAAGEGFESAFRRADQALYEAKRDGRNCVRLSRDVQGEPAGDNVIRLAF